MIRLTSFMNGSPIYVPADVVIKENYMYELKIEDGLQKAECKPLSGAIVVYDGIEYGVKESQEEVARKVLEWRLAWEGGDVETLYQMAGLEEPNHDTR